MQVRFISPTCIRIYSNERIRNFKGSSSFQVIYFNDTAMFQQFFKLVITPNSTTLDIGCNIGTHADMMLELELTPCLHLKRQSQILII